MTTDTRMTKKEAIEILRVRDGYFCWICHVLDRDDVAAFKSNEIPTLDHWIPKSAEYWDDKIVGSWDHVDNLRLAHRKCNTWKSDLIPNEDGSLPMKKRRIKPAEKRKQKKEIQDSICYVCNAGRNLGAGETCAQCGSTAGPVHAPHYLKKRSTECDHDAYWCWACSIGIVERQSAIMNLMIGRENG